MKYKTVAGIPLDHRERMFNTIYSVISSGLDVMRDIVSKKAEFAGINPETLPELNKVEQCHLYARIGARILQHHYGIDAVVCTGPARYHLSPDYAVLFGKKAPGGKHWQDIVSEDDYSHSWIVCPGENGGHYIIDFNAGLMQERGLPGWKKANLNRAVYWKHVNTPSEDVFIMDEDEFCYIEDTFCDPLYAFMQFAAIMWYEKPEDGDMPPKNLFGLYPESLTPTKLSDYKLAADF